MQRKCLLFVIVSVGLENLDEDDSASKKGHAELPLSSVMASHQVKNYSSSSKAASLREGERRMPTSEVTIVYSDSLECLHQMSHKMV